MKKTIGKTYTNKRGIRGSKLTLEFGSEYWLCGRYRFLTHGLTVAQVKERIASIQTHHEKKAARYFGFHELRGRQVGRFAITSATIREQGTNVLVRIVLADAEERIRIDRVYADCDAIPPNAALLALAEAAAAEREFIDGTAREYVETLTQALGAMEV